MPRPRRGESKDHFISRCMRYGDLQDRPQDQRVAICESLWSARHGKSCPPCPPCRPRTLSPYSYSLKFAPNLAALDGPALRDPVLDQGKMAATGILATTARDREGDVLEVAGIDTADHRLNPIVLLDHGVYYPLPIGKTQDPDGNYTVVIDPELGECRQTTYFDQHGEVANQVYDLIVQGILKANSIGYDPRKVQRLPADPLAGARAGKHILACSLIEATWCGIPVNPEAVRATLSRDRLCGKRIAPALKAVLAPYAAAPKTWSAGVTLPTSPRVILSPSQAESETRGQAMSQQNDTNRQGKSQSYLDQTAGGALVPEEDRKAGTVPDDVPTEPESDDPAGAEYLRDLHADLADLCAEYEAGLKKIEKEKVKKGVPKLLADLDAAREDVEEIFAAAYPELDPLGDGSDPEDDEQTDADDTSDDNGVKARSGRKAVVRPTPQLETKRLTKTQAGDVEDLKAFLAKMLDEGERLDGKTRSALKYHLRSLDDMLAKARTAPDPDSDDDLSEEDRKTILRIERDIARKERMLRRIGLA
jgi:hypothetical protein